MVNKFDLTELSVQINFEFDLFVCSSSFELRSLSIPLQLSKLSIPSVLVLSNKNLLEYVAENEQRLCDLFSKTECSVAEISTDDPIMSADSMHSAIVKVNKRRKIKTVLVDITTFTHESLLIFLRIVELFIPKAKIYCLYANAEQYSVGTDLEYKWLSKGIKEVRTVLGYPGEILPSKKTHLIVIVGYEYERAMETINTIEPNYVSLGYGRSGSVTTEQDKDREANERYAHLVSQMATSYPVHKFEIPCNDPFGAYIEIKSCIDYFNDTNVIVAPMNNKLSTLGAARAVLESRKAQICYAQAIEYNYSNYSNPGTKCYLVQLPIEKPTD